MSPVRYSGGAGCRMTLASWTIDVTGEQSEYTS
jgi:hypothetical protein